MAAQPALLVFGRVRRLQLNFLQFLARYAVDPNQDVDLTRSNPAEAAIYQTKFAIEDQEAKSRTSKGVYTYTLEDGNKSLSQCLVKIVVAPGLDSFKVDEYKQALAILHSEHCISHFCLVRSDVPGITTRETKFMNELVHFIKHQFPSVPATAVYLDEDTNLDLRNPEDSLPCLRGVQNMYLLTAEPVGAQQICAKERTVTNFLITLSFDVASSEVPQKAQLPPIASLGSMIQTLLNVLESLISYSRQLLEEAQGQRLTSQNLVIELQGEIGDVDTALTSFQKKLADLDNEVLELLKFESFEKRSWYRKEIFKIHLTTEYPIRDVKETIGDDSIQQSSYHAGNEYDGIVFNPAFKKGFARVELYGWRKDVHRVEILDLRSIIGMLIADRDGANARLCSLKEEVVRKEKRSAEILETIGIMDIDLITLRQPYERHWDYAAAKQLLKFGSLTSVAELLGLMTVVPRWYPVYDSECLESPVSPCPNPQDPIIFTAAVEYPVEVLSVGLKRTLPALSFSMKNTIVSLRATIGGFRALKAIQVSLATHILCASNWKDRIESTKNVELQSKAEGAAERMRTQLEQLEQTIDSPQGNGLEDLIIRANNKTDEINRQVCNIDIRLLAVDNLREVLRSDEDVPLGLAADLISIRSPTKTVQSLLLKKQHRMALENVSASQVNHLESAAGAAGLTLFSLKGKPEHGVENSHPGSSALCELSPQISSPIPRASQSPISVIVLGKTQAGKSSVLKALLEYGGHKELAEQVVTGRADVSVTDQVSNYEALIPIRTHVCRRENGDIVPEAVFEKMKDFAKRKLVYENGPSTSETVNLNLVDTPGLGDSRSMAEHRQRTGQTSTRLPDEPGQPRLAEYIANPVDERHKMAIVTALNKSPSIDAVCLIINSQEGLSGSVSLYLKQYVKLFEGISIDYVVIHTAVDYSKITGEAVKKRKHHVDELLGIYGHHHVIQTAANTKRAHEAHALNLSIAGILSTFQMSKPRSLGPLPYPKQDLHRNIDDTIRTVYDMYLSRLRIDIAAKESEKSEIESGDESFQLHVKSRVIDTQIGELELRLADLDSSEEIWMEGKKGYEPYHSIFPIHSTIHFKFNVDHPIRRAEESHDSYGTWYGFWGYEGERSLSCRWEARSDCYARAEIHLYTHKRDVHAADISSIRDRLSGRRAEKASVGLELSRIAGELKKYEESIEKCSTLVQKALAERNKMDVTDYYPSAFPKTWYLFCGCDVLCSSFGYELGLELPEEMLGDETDSLTGWEEALETEEEEQDSHAKFCGLVLSSIDERITALAALRTEIKSEIEKHDALMENVNLRLGETGVLVQSERDVLVRSVLDKLLSHCAPPTSTMPPRLRSDIEQMMLEEVEVTCELIVDASNLYGEMKGYLGEEIENLCGKCEAVDALLAQLQEIRGTWKGSEKHHRFQAMASAAAKLLMAASTKDGYLPIAAWAVLYRTIEAFKLSVNDQKTKIHSDDQAASKGHIILSLVRALAVAGELSAAYENGPLSQEDFQSSDDD